MREIPCDDDECTHNLKGMCGKPESVSVLEWDIDCDREVKLETYCLNSGLPASECNGCEGGCEIATW